MCTQTVLRCTTRIVFRPKKVTHMDYDHISSPAAIQNRGDTYYTHTHTLHCTIRPQLALTQFQDHSHTHAQTRVLWRTCVGTWLMVIWMEKRGAPIIIVVFEQTQKKPKVFRTLRDSEVRFANVKSMKQYSIGATTHLRTYCCMRVVWAV